MTQSDRRKYLSGNLDQMALSLSGGGVRAVGFHLGTMSMLRRLNLLNNVQIISSVSGGSLLGIGYSLAQQQENYSFQKFFDSFYGFLPETNVLEELLKGMSGRYPPSPSGRRDMITAMANVYDEHYFQKYYGKPGTDGGLTFDELLNNPGRGHVKEMIFNATEFKSGTAFRFQVSEFRCLIGNGNISLCRKHAGKIRIADIMAASSCIPVGMEPLFFPDDFRWPDDGKWKRWGRKRKRETNDEIREALSKNTNTKKPTFALMDGGVYDNQGITSTLLALNRRKDGFKERDTHECGHSLAERGRGDPPGPEEWAKWMSGQASDNSSYKHVEVKPEDLDLLIVSDTPVRKASFFPRVLLSKSGQPLSNIVARRTGPGSTGLWQKFKTWLANRITVGLISKLSWLLLLALSLSAIITAFETSIFTSEDWAEDKTFQLILITFHIALPFILLVMAGVTIFYYKFQKNKAIKKLQALIPHWDKNPKKYINKLRISDLLQMGILRAGSTAALTSTIYMDRIRGLGYSAAFSRQDLQRKVLTNEIFSLQEYRDPADPFHSMLRSKGLWEPPEELMRIIGVAATMSTKLWIDQDEDDPLSDLDYLVICGQATICYNLMKYIWRELREDDGTWLDPKMESVLKQAMAEWKKLMDNPLSLLIDRKINSDLPKLKEHAKMLQKLKPVTSSEPQAITNPA